MRGAGGQEEFREEGSGISGPRLDFIFTASGRHWRLLNGVNVLIYCLNGMALESEKGILTHGTWTVGVTGKLGLKLSRLLSSVAAGPWFLRVADR